MFCDLLSFGFDFSNIVLIINVGNVENDETQIDANTSCKDLIVQHHKMYP